MCHIWPQMMTSASENTDNAKQADSGTIQFLKKQLNEKKPEMVSKV